MPRFLTQENKNSRHDICLYLRNKRNSARAERRLGDGAATSRRREATQKVFLWKIVTGDEKWIYFNNPKRKYHWADPGEPTASTSERNLHCNKVMLCISWDIQGVPRDILFLIRADREKKNQEENVL